MPVHAVWICWVVSVIAVAATLSSVNYARGKAAWQSSQMLAFVPGNAVDGNTIANPVHSGTCSHTSVSYSPVSWWMVDLQRDVRVSRVVLVNRQDKYPERLRQFSLELYAVNPQACKAAIPVSSLYHNLSLPGGPTTFTFNLTRPVRWVQVIMRWGGAILTLCEVEVYGEAEATETRVFRLVPSVPGQAGVVVPVSSALQCALQCRHHRHCFAFSLQHPPGQAGGSCHLSIYSPPLVPPSTPVSNDSVFYTTCP